MSFGVSGDGSGGNETVGQEQAEKKIVKAITTETMVALGVIVAIFAVFAWRMGVAFTFKTAMATAHDLILNTVLFLMGVIILAGAFTSLISEFGVVSVANRILCPLMRPLFGLPGATSIGAVATYMSDNPAIMPLGTDKGFLKYFKKWQVTTLVNLGTVFGMGLIVTTFMLAQSTEGESLGRAVLLGNIGAILGGIVSVRLMGVFGKRKYGKDEDVLTEGDEGYDILRYREVREGNAAQRALQSMLDGGSHGVKTGLDIMPGVVVVCTIVMMLAFGPSEGGVYTGAAYEGIAFFPWIGEKLSFIIEPLFGFSNRHGAPIPGERDRGRQRHLRLHRHRYLQRRLPEHPRGHDGRDEGARPDEYGHRYSFLRRAVRWGVRARALLGIRVSPCFSSLTTSPPTDGSRP